MTAAPLVAHVASVLARHRLVQPATRVVAALSGGPDSVALAHLLDALDRQGALRLAALAHVNHQLRGAEAAADERLCQRLATQLGRPLAVSRVDVGARMAREHLSLEHAAHLERYEALRAVADERQADVIALGHTRDDQAETFLLRLLRGAGPKGLAAMHPRNGIFIRPLLYVRRGELLEYLAAHDLEYAHDASNDDVSIARNRVRAELLPLLVDRFNPAIVDRLADQAELSRDDWSWIEAEADRAGAAVTQGIGNERRLDAAALARLPLALARAVVWREMRAMAGGRPIAFDQVEPVLRLSSQPGPPFDAPGQRVERVGDSIVLRRRERSRGQDRRGPVDKFHQPLPIPGEVAVRGTRYIVSARPGPISSGSATHLDPTVAFVRLDRCGRGLAVRHRRPGDRFRPLGLAGRKTLQNLFVDRKVARADRDGVPVVVDDGDQIVWVAGHAIAHEFRVTDPSQPVLVLELKLSGGSA